MPNLKTCFCHSCGKFAEYPYQSTTDKELYHKVCLPEPSVPDILTHISSGFGPDSLIEEFQNRLNQEPRV